jgi:hypothetical protein
VRPDPFSTYASVGGQGISSVTPLTAADLANLSTGLSQGSGTATLSLPTDSAVMKQDLSQQVFLILQYHFGVT